MTIYFTRYVHKMLIKMLSLYYHESMRKIEEHEGTKCFMFNDFMVNKPLDKIKEMISIEKFDNTKILSDTDQKLSDDITLKNVVILMACVIKDDDDFYPQIFLEEALYAE